MKTLVTYRPNTIQNAMNDFDRYFESFFGDSMLNSQIRNYSRLPAVDIRETEKSYVIDMELPGYDEHDVEIHVDGASLSIASKQQEETKDANDNQGTWILRERRINPFSRSFKMPENSNPEKVSAEFRKGILTIEIEKSVGARKRAIQIKAK